MRTGKILGLVVGGLVVLFALVLIGIKLFVNPNDFKPRIAAQVKQSTGRELVLSGDIKLSVFPWISLELGPASLGNPPGFSAEPFVSFNHASVRVKLLPLLSKRLEVGRVEVDGLDAKLAKNAEGKGNWEGFGKSDAAAPPEPGKAPGALPEIEGIKITNARVSYQKILIQNFNLETGAFAGKSVVPITLHVEANRGVAGETAALDVKLDASADMDAERYHIAALNLNSVASLAGNPKPVRVSLSAPTIDVDLKAQTLSVPSFALNAAGADVTGSAAGTSIVDALAVKGNLKLAPLVLREYLPRLNVTLPQTRDPKALSQLALSSDFGYAKSILDLEQLQVTLDDTHLKGKLALNTATEGMKFDLAVDTLNADRYLPPAPPAPPAGSPPPPEPKPAAEPESKPLDANGTLTVGSLHFSPLDLTSVKVVVASADKVMHIHPLQAQVYGGQYAGDITLDSRAKVPALSLDEHLTGVDVGKLVASESKTLHVTGRGNVNIKGTARGEGADAIMKTLNGRFDMNVANGAVEGVDLGYALAQAEALIKRQPGAVSVQNTKQTKFDALKMSADIVNGVASTKDLIISSAVLKVTGQGSVNLPVKSLDMSLLADTLQKAGTTAIKIPVKVTGAMADPTIRPDVEALAKGQLKDKAQQVIGDKLKGLFSK